MSASQSPNRISARELTERLGVILARMLPFSTALPEIYRLVRDLTTQRTDLDKKILKAHDALQDTSTLLAELEQGLKDRAEKLEKIRAEYDSPMAHLFGPWEGLPPEVQGNYKNTVAFFNAQWGA